MNKISTSKCKGVRWCKTYEKWCIVIKINEKAIFLPYASIEQEAPRKYNKKALELDGESAKPDDISDEGGDDEGEDECDKD